MTFAGKWHAAQMNVIVAAHTQRHERPETPGDRPWARVTYMRIYTEWPWTSKEQCVPIGSVWSGKLKSLALSWSQWFRRRSKWNRKCAKTSGPYCLHHLILADPINNRVLFLFSYVCWYIFSTLIVENSLNHNDDMRQKNHGSNAFFLEPERKAFEAFG